MAQVSATATATRGSIRCYPLLVIRAWAVVQTSKGKRGKCVDAAVGESGEVIEGRRDPEAPGPKPLSLAVPGTVWMAAARLPARDELVNYQFLFLRGRWVRSQRVPPCDVRGAPGRARRRGCACPAAYRNRDCGAPRPSKHGSPGGTDGSVKRSIAEALPERAEFAVAAC